MNPEEMSHRKKIDELSLKMACTIRNSCTHILTKGEGLSEFDSALVLANSIYILATDFVCDGKYKKALDRSDPRWFKENRLVSDFLNIAAGGKGQLTDDEIMESN